MLLGRKELIGYFDYTERSDELEKLNQYTFVEIKNSKEYRSIREMKYVTTVEGDLIMQLEYMTNNV